MKRNTLRPLSIRKLCSRSGSRTNTEFDHVNFCGAMLADENSEPPAAKSMVDGVVSRIPSPVQSQNWSQSTWSACFASRCQ